MTVSGVVRWVGLVAGGGLGVLWFRERSVASEWDVRRQALQEAEQQRADLQSDRVRLRERLDAASVPTSDPVVVATELERGLAAASLTLGEWVAADKWSHQGQSTPRETVATMLWAAVGGDVAVLKQVFEFDEAAHAKATEWHAALPPGLRATYPTPEDLVASVTLRNIPPMGAQLIWFNQTDTDHAMVGVLLGGPEFPLPVADPVADTAGDRPPPMISAQNSNRLALLKLHRSADGWRIQVPVTAVEQLASELSGESLPNP